MCLLSLRLLALAEAAELQHGQEEPGGTVGLGPLHSLQDASRGEKREAAVTNAENAIGFRNPHGKLRLNRGLE